MLAELGRRILEKVKPAGKNALPRVAGVATAAALFAESFQDPGVSNAANAPRPDELPNNGHTEVMDADRLAQLQGSSLQQQVPGERARAAQTPGVVSTPAPAETRPAVVTTPGPTSSARVESGQSSTSAAQSAAARERGQVAGVEARSGANPYEKNVQGSFYSIRYRNDTSAEFPNTSGAIGTSSGTKDGNPIQPFQPKQAFYSSEPGVSADGPISVGGHLIDSATGATYYFVGVWSNTLQGYLPRVEGMSHIDQAANYNARQAVTKAGLPISGINGNTYVTQRLLDGNGNPTESNATMIETQFQFANNPNEDGRYRLTLASPTSWQKFVETTPTTVSTATSTRTSTLTPSRAPTELPPSSTPTRTNTLVPPSVTTEPSSTSTATNTRTSTTEPSRTTTGTNTAKPASPTTEPASPTGTPTASPRPSETAIIEPTLTRSATATGTSSPTDVPTNQATKVIVDATNTVVIPGLREQAPAFRQRPQRPPR